MPTHNVFTEIDAKSYAAIVKNGWLSEVLLALLVDPLEADDMADSIDSVRETAIELDLNGRVFAAPITLKDFQSLPSKDALEKLKITLSQWAMTTKRADIAVERLTIWNRRFGVWCVCAVAREALRFVPEGELRPLRAIETAEAWVRGMATAAQVSAARVAAAYAAAAAAAAAADAATSAAAAARAAAASAAASYADAAYADAAAYASESAAYAANAANAANAARDTAELVRLREVVANACLTFPG